MRWVSVDPSTKCSGIASWDGAALTSTHAVMPSTDGDEWLRMLADLKPTMLVYEAAAQGGKGYQTAVILEQHRGDIRRWCAMAGVRDEFRLGIQEWRSVLGVKGPGRDVRGSAARTKAWKAAARECVRLHVLGGQLHELALAGREDEIDAVCIGLAWLRMTEVAEGGAV